MPAELGARRLGASMGPRPHGRGGGSAAAFHLSAWPAASMGPRPHGRGGAKNRPVGNYRIALLQWGHGRMAVEGRRLGPRGRHARLQLQWGHGRMAVEGLRRKGPGHARQPRFNGATAAWPWRGSVASAKLSPTFSASMGPRPHGRGGGDFRN